jgi:hypothetical protein
MNKKHLLFALSSLLSFSAVQAAPHISRIEMANDAERIIDNRLERKINIYGNAFGRRADKVSNDDNFSYLPILWDDFESGNLDKWSFRAGGKSWEVSSRNHRPNSSYSAHKLSRNGLDSMQIRPASHPEYYTSFWMYLSPGSTSNNDKYFRAGDTITKKNLIVNYNTNSRYLQTTVEHAVGQTKGRYGTHPMSALRGSWNFVEVMWGMPIDRKNRDKNYFELYINGKLKNRLTPTEYDKRKNNTDGLWKFGETMTKSPYISLGTWFRSSGNYNIGDGWYFDDVYISHTRARVVLGNAPVYSDCTHLEMQIPTAWYWGRVSINLNQGSFDEDESVYLFVIDKNNKVSNGYPVSLVDIID